MVAWLVVDQLPKHILQKPNFRSDLQHNADSVFSDGFQAMNASLQEDYRQLCRYSGTTCSVVLRIFPDGENSKGKLHFAHVGDSAVVLGVRESENII